MNMHRIPLLGLLAAVLTVCLPVSALAESVTDVRVLIDVSGSMKKNDPQNLRAPAVRMLVGLMPEGTRSGIWTFGRYVNMQVKLDKVDKAWKQRAMQEADKIHSRGLFTNIEDAIKKSTTDWQRPDPSYRRHLILLTDGMVDIDKDPRLNEQSRRRLLQEILPRIEAADAKIHTIALSKNADLELLNALSGATGGANEQVESADQLQRIFFRMFEKSVKPDTLPIEDNKFTVDKHVSDITVLVFLAKESPPTQLTLPNGEKWSQKKHPQTVSWHHEQGYDLITIKGPLPGEWLLQANVDPDNRVMVVTNLRLKVDNMPNTLMLGDAFDTRARLMEEGKTVTNQNLLAVTEFDVKLIDGEDRVVSTKLMDNGNSPDVIKGDGVYSAAIESVEKAGNYEIAVRAKSLTFKRIIRHTLQVHDSPANITIEQHEAQQPFIITITPHAGLIRPETVSMQLAIADLEPQIIKQVDDLKWQIQVPAEHANKKVVLTLAGNRYSNEAIKMDFEQVLAVTGEAQSLALKIKPKETVPVEQPAPEKAVAEKAPEQEQPADNMTEDSEAESDGFNWTMVLSLVVGINIILFGVGWFVLRLWRKRMAREQEEVEAELEV